MAQVNCPNRSQTYNLPIVLNSGASLTERKETRDRPALGRLTRTMVSNFLPQRIVRQYTQYYKETGFEAFSERTMLRVVNESPRPESLSKALTISQQTGRVRSMD